MKVFRSGPCVFSIRFADSRLVLPSLVGQCGTCGSGKAETYTSDRQTGSQAPPDGPWPCTCSACQSTPSLISAVYITGLLLTVSVRRMCSVFSRNSTCTWSQAHAFLSLQSTMVPNSNIWKDAAQRKWFMSLKRETVYKSVVLFVNDLLEKNTFF